MRTPLRSISAYKFTQHRVLPCSPFLKFHLFIVLSLLYNDVLMRQMSLCRRSMPVMKGCLRHRMQYQANLELGQSVPIRRGRLRARRWLRCKRWLRCQGEKVGQCNLDQIFSLYRYLCSQLHFSNTNLTTHMPVVCLEPC